jgi:hypothetical protein
MNKVSRFSAMLRRLDAKFDAFGFDFREDGRPAHWYRTWNGHEMWQFLLASCKSLT